MRSKQLAFIFLTTLLCTESWCNVTVKFSLPPQCKETQAFMTITHIIKNGDSSVKSKEKIIKAGEIKTIKINPKLLESVILKVEKVKGGYGVKTPALIKNMNYSLTIPWCLDKLHH